ncbi:hypothetical protein GS19_07965 [Acinetobacter idrijaensis]|jgi:hypothetical protein|nr:hypothetical protein GS19_07965 [Acinetobacter idrijaensis]
MNHLNLSIIIHKDKSVKSLSYLGELDDESDLERRGSGREIANIELTFSEAVFASLMELYLNESGLI